MFKKETQWERLPTSNKSLRIGRRRKNHKKGKNTK